MTNHLTFMWVLNQNWETVLSQNEDTLKKEIHKILSRCKFKLGSISFNIEKNTIKINISEDVKDTLVMVDCGSVSINIDSFNDKLNSHSIEQMVNDIFEFIKDKITMYFSDSMFDKESEVVAHPEFVLISDSGDMEDMQFLLDDKEEIFHDKNLVSAKKEHMVINSLNFCQQILNCDFSDIINKISQSNDMSTEHLILFPLNNEFKVIDKIEFVSLKELKTRCEVENESYVFMLPYEYSPNSIKNSIQSVSSLSQTFMHSALFSYAKSRYSRQVDSELSKFLTKYLNDSKVIFGVRDVVELMKNYVKTK